MGEVHRHRGGPGATGRREAPADKLQLIAAGVDPPRPEEVEPNPPSGYIVSLVRCLLALLKYPFYPLFNFDNGM